MLTKGLQYFKSNRSIISRLKSSLSVDMINKTSVDQSEATHFANLRENWWDPEGPLRALHKLNALRLPFITGNLRDSGIIDIETYQSKLPLKDLSIADVGCGCGILTEALAKSGGNVTGIDVVEDLIKLAVAHSNETGLGNVRYVCELIERYANANPDRHDIVVASEVIEHVTDKELFVDGCVKCLKPGGSIIFTTLNRTISSRFHGIFLAENVLGAIPKGTHEWNKFIKPEELQDILAKLNCKTVSVRGMNLNLFNTKWHWTKSADNWYSLYAIKQK